MGNGRVNTYTGQSSAEKLDMKTTHKIYLMVVASLFCITGCNKTTESEEKADTAADKAVAAAEVPKDPNEVVASVNGVPLLRSTMDKMVNAVLQAQNVPPEHMANAREQFEGRVAYSFIMKTLLLGEAKKQGVELSAEERQQHMDKISESLAKQGKTLDEYFKESPVGEEAAREELEEGVVIDSLLTKMVLDKIEISEDAIKEYKADIEKRNAEILAASENADADKAGKRKMIEEIKTQLDGGADFKELAGKYSDCPSGRNGGDLGKFTRGQMVKPFEDAAFSQEVGKVGEIVESDFGFHLIKVTEKHPAQKASDSTPAVPESVTASHILVKVEQAGTPIVMPADDEITQQLKQQQSREAIAKYIKELQDAAKIETVLPGVQL